MNELMLGRLDISILLKKLLINRLSIKNNVIMIAPINIISIFTVLIDIINISFEAREVT
jgi:hypothetical protein